MKVSDVYTKLRGRADPQVVQVLCTMTENIAALKQAQREVTGKLLEVIQALGVLASAMDDNLTALKMGQMQRDQEKREKSEEQFNSEPLDEV